VGTGCARPVGAGALAADGADGGGAVGEEGMLAVGGAGRRPPERPGWLTLLDRLRRGWLSKPSNRGADRGAGIVAKLSVRLAPFLHELLLVRGCRIHLPSAWFTGCACPTGPVAFRFILLCLCLPVSLGRIGTVVASPCQENLSRSLLSRQTGRFRIACVADVPPERSR
jgi:hypothetical protein